jgi:ubiquinone biosynthesis protein
MRLVARSLYIWLLAMGHLALLTLGLLLSLLRGRDRATRFAYTGRQLAAFCRQAGATFIKLGQVLSTRPDLLPGEACRELEGLQERVGPFSFDAVRETIVSEFAAPLEQLFARFDPYPVASASIAQVHRAELANGQVVAVKVLRPHVERQVATDLRAMMLGVSALYWLPMIRGSGLSSILVQFADAMRQQLDLRFEARNNRAFADNFRGDPSVHLPKLHEQLCSRRVLCMEYIEGDRLFEAAKAPHQASELAAAGYRMLLKMIFIDGLVHADLHPGNLVVHEGKLVLLDVGLVAQLSKRHRSALRQLCLAWIARDVAGVCSALPAAAFFEQPPSQPRRLHQQVESLLTRYGDVTLSEIPIGRLLLDLLRLVRGQWPRVDPAYSMVAVSIAVVEGVGRQLSPEMRLMAQAMPFFQRHDSPHPSSTLH